MSATHPLMASTQQGPASSGSASYSASSSFASSSSAAAAAAAAATAGPASSSKATTATLRGARAPDEPHLEADDDFVTQLRTRTQQQHNTSNALIQLCTPLALSSPNVYRLLLASFYHVFATLEQLLHTLRLNYPKLSPMYFRELDRVPAFQRDIAFYFGPAASITSATAAATASASAATSSSSSSSSSSPHPAAGNNVAGASDGVCSNVPPPSPATRAYVAELRTVVEEEPVLLVAYCQSMYMALLGGGPYLQRWLVTAFSLTPPHGCAIFDFTPGIPDAAKFRARYAETVNSLSLTHAQRERIIQQKRRVFECNNSLVREVCASLAFRQRVAFVLRRLAVVAVIIFAVVWVLVGDGRTAG